MAGKGPSVEGLKCLNCDAPLTLRVPGQTVAIVCASCATINDVSNPQVRILDQAAQRLKVKPLIPLGQRGKLHGEPYETIGFMTRCDKTGTFEWREYLLFNPRQGFRWLMESNGHWTYMIMTKQKPKWVGTRKSYLGRTFKPFLIGTAKVTYVMGEFYWEVKVGDTVQIADFICPPEILSMEKSGREEIWSIGEYIEPETIRDAFGIKEPMPLRTGVAPNQPYPGESKWKQRIVTATTFVLLTIVQVFSVARARGDLAYQGDFVYRQADTEPVKVTPPFELSGQKANVAIRTSAPLANNWLYLNMVLTEEATGKAYHMGREIAYYSGVDSDGSWSEGGRNDKFFLSSIPGGTYRLSITPEGAPGLAEIPFNLSVERDAVSWANYGFMALFLAALALFDWLRRVYFEYRRSLEGDLGGEEEEE